MTMQEMLDLKKVYTVKLEDVIAQIEGAKLDFKLEILEAMLNVVKSPLVDFNRSKKRLTVYIEKGVTETGAPGYTPVKVFEIKEVREISVLDNTVHFIVIPTNSEKEQFKVSYDNLVRYPV